MSQVVTGREPDPFWEVLTLGVGWAKTPAQREAMDRYVSSLVKKSC